MKVRDLMTAEVKCCGPHDTLNTAAHIMWDNNCGCVPVVDQSGHPIGIITDRDISMAAYTQGVSLSSSHVSSAMSRALHTCGADDEVAAAAKSMGERQVRRIPVVDGEGRLAGIVALSDLVRLAEKERRSRSRKRTIKDGDLVQMLAEICAHGGQHATPPAANSKSGNADGAATDD